MSENTSFKARVRRRLIKAVSDLYPEVEIVRARAWVARELPAGQRWMADERSLGKGTHDAYVVIIKRKPESTPGPTPKNPS
ncbi:MAG: hypothetical protein JNK85_26170 [Verrucomicrobiales bacterium]|nr:hypothetical protein [Verrucomicrobiales bacterium]